VIVLDAVIVTLGFTGTLSWAWVWGSILILELLGAAFGATS